MVMKLWICIPTVVVDSDIEVSVFFSLHDLKTLYMERKVTFLIS